MTEFIVLNTIGVSKDSQLRAAKILNAVADSIDDNPKGTETFFQYGYNLMEMRWNQLRAAVNKSRLFSLPNFSSGTCTFTSRSFEPLPGNHIEIIKLCIFLNLLICCERFSRLVFDQHALPFLFLL